MNLEELDELIEAAKDSFGDPTMAGCSAAELGVYMWRLRDAAASALNLLENLETDDIFLGARKVEVLARLREELGE